MISEYDTRQLTHLSEQFSAFKCGELHISGFISDAVFLLDAMEGIPLEWRQRLHEFVATLEEVYAVSLDREGETIDEQGRRLISKAIDGIESCLIEVKAQGREE